MRVSRKGLRWLVGCALAIVALLALTYLWLVPALIVNRLEAVYGGRVRIGGWWVAGSSSGVRDLVLHEGAGVESPVLARVEAVSTDLTLGGLLTGHLQPGKLTLVRPEITIRLDRDGDARTTIPHAEPGDGGGGLAVPEVVVEDATLTFRQEGREPMVIQRLEGRLAPGPEGLTLTALADDPSWGRLEGRGRFAADLGAGSLRLWSNSLVADAEKARRLPFVPEATWDHLLPTGPLGVVLTVNLPASPTQALEIRTDVTFQGTSLDLPTLGIQTVRTTGQLSFADGVVRVSGVRGQAVGGTISADGTLDFASRPPRIDLNLALDGVDIAQAPERWRLKEAGVTGEISGRAHLVVRLTDQGADLTESSGEAVVTGGTIEGIPTKSLKLKMKGEGGTIRYDAGGPSTSWLRSPIAADLIAIQPPQDGGKGGLILPKTLSTEVEFEDVDLTDVLSKADALGVHLPFVVAGKLSLKAQATIPLGKLRELSAYAFHGEATLKGGNVAGVDIGHATARLDLEDGVLELSDFRGRLLDRPEGGLLNLPEPTAPTPEEGPLPPGGFRGHLRAELSPPGPLTAHLEAGGLPLGELAAPALPRPTPLAGRVDLNFDLSGDLRGAFDPKAWTLDARIASRSITYEDATLDAVDALLHLRDGRLDVEQLDATLDGHPLRARGGLGLTAPYPFDAFLSVEAWDLAKLIALVPQASGLAPLAGRLTAEATADGTLRPWHVASRGRGRLSEFAFAEVAVGDVPVRWATGAEAVEVEVVEAHPFGGMLSAQARIPTGGGPITGEAKVQGIDTSRLAAALPGDSLALSGLARGEVSFTIRPGARPGDPVPLEANVRLEAPDLSVQGIPARALEAAITLRGGLLSYDLYAESLGGKLKFKGTIPLERGPPPSPGASEVEHDARDAHGRVEAIGFTIREEFWRALGVTGALARLRGQGALVANVRFDPSAGVDDLRVRGLAEIRELRWGPNFLLGRLRGTFARAGTGWELDPLNGELLGGVATGWARGGTLVLAGVDSPAGPVEGGGQPLRFELNIQRLALQRLAALAPPLAGLVEGNGSLQIAGHLGEALRARGELRAPSGRLAGIPLAELRAPVELSLNPTSGVGTLQARRWSARLAGGFVQGTAQLRFGTTRAFESDIRLSDLELEYLTRLFSEARHPGSGKVSGVVTLKGLDSLRPETYRGRADLTLADAAVLDLPVFRSLDRFLGGQAGGMFEQGEVRAGIGNRQVVVEELNLQGRIAQLHASGTVGFDGELDLIVLINTNQIIAQTGPALVALIPGLSGARGGTASLQVANFLSNRLVKLRVRGSLRSPSVSVDPTVTVTNAAVGFFAGALKLPIGLLK